MLNYDWLLSGEAVDAVGTGRSGDASLGYSSLGWAIGWFQAGFQLCLDADDDDALSPARSHLPGEFAGLFWGREVLLAVISWVRRGGLVYPVKVAFQRPVGSQ